MKMIFDKTASANREQTSGQPSHSEGSNELWAQNILSNAAAAKAKSAEPETAHGKNLEDALTADFGGIPQVKKIFVERSEGSLLVWVAADHPAREVREQIFQKQFDLIDAFPDTTFDFNIISTAIEDPTAVLSGAKLVFHA